MGKKLWVSLLLLVVVPGFLFTASCAKKQIETDAVTLQEQEAEAARQAALKKAEAEALARQRAIEEERLREEQLREEAEARERSAAMERFMNEDIHFAFDKSVLTSTAQEILKTKAEWLRNNPDATVVIEGHCDERGTTEYNIALGERRALAAKAFVTDLGIESSRLSTISYGEERPVDPGHNEDAWVKNRRAHFVIE